jgi:hypothetical protein
MKGGYGINLNFTEKVCTFILKGGGRKTPLNIRINLPDINKLEGFR